MRKKNMEERKKLFDASVIIDELLKGVGLNAPTFAKRIGVNYQRIFDLQRGRVKKFNPEIVKSVCKQWPQVNANYLYTGDGSLFLTPGEPMDVSVEDMVARAVRSYMQSDEQAAKLRELESREERLDRREEMLAGREEKVTGMLATIAEREAALQEKAGKLSDLEHSLMERELELMMREKDLGNGVLKKGEGK